MLNNDALPLIARLRTMSATGWHPIGNEAADEIDRLTRELDEARAERDAMAKDAERFRWLLDQELPDWMDVYHQHPDRVRAAIDAQIEQEQPK